MVFTCWPILYSITLAWYVLCYQNPESEVEKPVKGQKKKTEEKIDSSNSRWTEKQAKVLVTKWKEDIEELESSQNRMVWNRFVNDINLIGPKKNINQEKKKIICTPLDFPIPKTAAVDRKLFLVDSLHTLIASVTATCFSIFIALR